ncbi:MAG: ParB/RepB/Spo0J family partition protein [Bacilli bacterium]|nr:ParB/RepB/Spo0J family partition protein [Bacilli bacterium]MDD3305346.1 ParB/RepB/Spo0J family partition protein [Bacilli bacterium]MDD4053247.1 ParB/RepB/Spo0J family partition protein [Bacilli bacterium]MDD4411229.1 ParB/RepB/Spo0J family partition protein [Bacilli bacterium]
MENKRRALGKGLEQLFNAENLDFNQLETSIVEGAAENEITKVKLTELRSNPYQPRKVFDETALKELSDSIKENGVFQPIIVKKSIKGYEIIAGERRVKASIMAGLETIPAIIRDFTDEEMMQIALLENLQREDLNAIEEANAYKSMIDSLGITQEELSKKLGKSRSHVTNMLGLLRLSDYVQSLVLHGKISMGHARVLSKLSDNEKIESLANRIIREDLSVRTLETLVSDEGKEIEKKKPKANNRQYSYIEETLREKLGTKVTVNNHKVQISFANDEELERLLKILNVKIEE